MRKLNQLVKYARPSLPIKELVKGWYGNDFVNGTFTPWRPAAWDDDPATPANESDLYTVYATACRGCHAAHFSFDEPSYFPGISRVCGPAGPGQAGGSPTMAHAKLTYLNLWRADFPQGPTLGLMEDYFGDLATPQLCD